MTVAAIANPALLDSTLTSERVSHVHQRAVLSFPPFRLDFLEERLWKGAREVPLRRKPFAILRYLAQRPRRLVTRSDILEAVWGSPVATSEGLLRSHMHDLRHTMGEEVIETVNGRGYRFMATVSDADHGSVEKRAVEGRPFELMAAAPGSVDPMVTRAVQSDAHARVLKQIADALAQLGLRAGVVLVVGDAQSMGLPLTTSAGHGHHAPTPSQSGAAFVSAELAADVRRTSCSPRKAP